MKLGEEAILKMFVICTTVIIPSTCQNTEYQDIQNSNFVICFVWCETWSLTLINNKNKRNDGQNILTHEG